MVRSTITPSAPSPSCTAGSRSALRAVRRGAAHREQRAVGGDQGGRDDLGAQPPERRPGAVGAGGGGAADRLRVNVAEVLHRQGVRPQQRRYLPQPGAGGERGGPGGSIDGEQSAECAEVQLDARCERDAGEAVACADRFHPQPAVAGITHQGDHLVDAGGPGHEFRAHGGAAAPVAPDGHRNTRPSPR